MGGGYNYTLKLRTFDQLMSDVKSDLPNYALENMIDAGTLIKVARRCNYDLGLRIHSTKETLLEVEKGRVKLPDDFYSANFAFICGTYTESQILPQGTHTEEVPVTSAYYKSVPASINTCASPVICSNCHIVPCGCSTTVNTTAATSCSCNCTPCSCPSTNICLDATYLQVEPYGDWWKKPRVFMNCNSECFEIIQILKTGGTRTWSITQPLKFISNAEGIECGCPGLYFSCQYEAWIKNGWLYTNFTDCANIYLNYQGMLEDDDGNLLVPDHEGINDFYEYSIKARILENLFLNDENTAPKLQLVEERRKVAKGAAKAIVHTPNFAEFQSMFEHNRKAMYQRYFTQFSSYPAFIFGGY